MRSGTRFPRTAYEVAARAHRLAQTVYNAIKEGYRLFDGASDYGNEKEAGEGIALAIKDGLIKREDVCEYHHVFGV